MEYFNLKKVNIMEEWRTIIGFENYQISNLGRVKITTNDKSRKERLLKLSVTNRGYIRVGLYKSGKVSSKLVHRLVAEAFIPNSENKPQINHIDCNKQNNNSSNLEWCTHEENHFHATQNGLREFGEEHYSTNLTESSIKEIRKLLLKKIPRKEIAKKYDISEATIKDIKHGRIWGKKLKTLPNVRPPYVKIDKILKIKELLQQGVTEREISKQLSCSRATISRVKQNIYSDYEKMVQNSTN